MHLVCIRTTTCHSQFGFTHTCISRQLNLSGLPFRHLAVFFQDGRKRIYVKIGKIICCSTPILLQPHLVKHWIHGV